MSSHASKLTWLLAQTAMIFLSLLIITPEGGITLGTPSLEQITASGETVGNNVVEPVHTASPGELTGASTEKSAEIPHERISLADNQGTPTTTNTTTATNSTNNKKCDPTTCLLPDCRCVGTDIPGGLPACEVPQMVLLTVDDEVTAHTFPFYQALLFPEEQLGREGEGEGGDMEQRQPAQFHGVLNPNGCPAAATFFVSDTHTNMSMVRALADKGHEVASHSMSHSLSYKHAWDPEEWEREIQGMRELLANGTGLNVSQIQGMRAPNLQLGGDVQYSMLQRKGFLYDSSMYGGALEDDPDRDFLWPFTLDYPPELPTPHAVCDQSDCPTRSYPGLWEVQLGRLYTLSGESCAMADVCPMRTDANETEILEFLRYNFRRRYQHNRAPLMIAIHPRWFTRVPASYQALRKFLHEISHDPDVWQVTVSQMLDWVQNPKPISRLNELPSWQCTNSLNHKLEHFTGVVFTFCTFGILFSGTIVLLIVLELRNIGFLLTGLVPEKGGRYKRVMQQDSDNLVVETPYQ